MAPKISLLFAFLLLVGVSTSSDYDRSKNLEILTPYGSGNLIVAKGETVSDIFDFSRTYDSTNLSCAPQNIFIDSSSSTSRTFTIKNISSGGLTVSRFSVDSSDTKVVNIEASVSGSQTLQPDGSVEYVINYTCNEDADSDSWAYIEIQVEEQLSYQRFKYIKSCSPPGFPWAIPILFVMATVIVAVGVRQSGIVIDDDGTEERTEVQSKHAFFFVIVASAMLLLIFYFGTILNIIMNVIIFFSGTTTGAFYIGAAIEWGMDKGGACESLFRKVRLPVFGQICYYEVLSLVISLLLITAYMVTRYWFLNNLVAIFLTLVFFKAFRLQSLKVAALLLWLAFLYDIFWVFISPSVFKGNVMVTAATSINAPIKLLWPGSTASVERSCSMLGLGDMALPGLLICYLFSYGNYKLTQSYYYSSVAAYFIALVCCGVSLIAFQAAQPALLYIVPALFASLFIVSWVRSQGDEFKEMWKGFKDDREDREALAEDRELADAINA